VDGATTTVVGIIGDDPLVSRILGMLLEGAGYEARPLDEAAALEDPSVALAGVDLVLFLPLLGDERKGELLGVLKGEQATAEVPVLSLSTDPKAQLDERSDFVLRSWMSGRTLCCPGRGPRKPSCWRSSRPCMRLAEKKRRRQRYVCGALPLRTGYYLTCLIDVSSILSAPLASSPYPKDPFGAPGVPASPAPPPGGL
jgi:hypothetical protein